MRYQQIVKNIFHIGDTTTANGLDCNPYILIDGEEAVLFDPGSRLDFEHVLDNIQTLTSLSSIKYIVLHHEDPDFCSAVPLLEKAGINAEIVTSWRTMTLVQYYDIRSPYYLLEEHGHRLSLKSGRILEFIPTPYLHFAGAFATYDSMTETLFSSDLFGAFSYNHTLYADEQYLEKMLTFHEHYMPSNSVLRPVMDILLGYRISQILPQHGAVINRDVESYIHALRTLECGTLLTPIKKNLLASGGYITIFNDVLKRYESLYEKEAVQKLFAEMPELIMDKSGRITDYFGEPEMIWNALFEMVKSQKGMLWLTVIEPFVRGIVATYDIPMPEIMSSALEKAETENKRLVEQNQSLEQTIHNVNERLTKCSITGLYNEVFFKSLLMEELENEDWRDVGVFASVGIDNFSNYNLRFGSEEAGIALNNMAYLLKEIFGGNTVYKLDSADFGLYIKGYDRIEAVDLLEKGRLTISKSEIFLGSLTISIGAVFPSELQYDSASYDLAALRYMELAGLRLAKAKQMGKNCVCFEGEDIEAINMLNNVLIVDTDETNREIIKLFLTDAGINVFTAADGYEALTIVGHTTPKVVVSEINLPKMDGFLLREALLKRSATKDVETIFLSYQKNEDSVARAISLGVSHYIKKPYMLSELMGIIKRSLKEME